MIKHFKNIGPAILITSAFIGPGTVTVCSLAGYQFGYSLLWALLFSIFATVVLQEMCARLGLVTKKGLGEIIRTEISQPIVKVGSIILVLSAILIGNSAYEAGNISGAALGIQEAFSTWKILIFGFSVELSVILITTVAFAILVSGSYKVIEKSMILLVSIMSLVFITSALFSLPSVIDILSDLFIPSVPDESTMLIIALIGTTVVPYNLFLHTSSVSERWKNISDLPKAQSDTFISIGMGGIISLSIVISSAAVFMYQGGAVNPDHSFSSQLEPILGSYAKYFMGIGLFAAGISSSITAPLAAAYATTGILGYRATPKSRMFKSISLGVLMVGFVFSILGFKPMQVIQFAQFANGLLLPSIAIFVIWLVNKKQLMGNYTNSTRQNIAGVFIILSTVLLGFKSVLSVFDLWK